LGFENPFDGKLDFVWKNLDVSNVLGDSGGVEKLSSSVDENLNGFLPDSDLTLNMSETDNGARLEVVSCSN
jgi:hypothetical protein